MPSKPITNDGPSKPITNEGESSKLIPNVITKIASFQESSLSKILPSFNFKLFKGNKKNSEQLNPIQTELMKTFNQPKTSERKIDSNNLKTSYLNYENMLTNKMKKI